MSNDATNNPTSDYLLAPTTSTDCECGARGPVMVHIAGSWQSFCRLHEPRNRQGLPWTLEEDRRLRALVGRGWSYRDIGQALGRSVRSVANRVYMRRGLPQMLSGAA